MTARPVHRSSGPRDPTTPRRRHSTGRGGPGIDSGPWLADVGPGQPGQDGLEAHLPDGSRRRLACGVPGERVLVVPEGSDGEWVRVIRVMEASPDRVEPPCPRLEACGACTLQALAYEAQLRHKERSLDGPLSALGCRRPLRVRGLPRPFGIRTRLLFPAFLDRGVLRFGLYRRGSMTPVRAEACPVQHPFATGLLVMAAALLQGPAGARRLWDPSWLQALGLRTDPVGEQAQLLLCGRGPDLPGGEAQLRALASLPGISSISLAVQPRRSSFPLDAPLRLLWGEPRQVFHLGPLRCALSPGTFLQTSHLGTQLLLESVRALMPSEAESLADLYGGAGFFARACQDRWQHALVVEQNPQAVGDLRAALADGSLPGLDCIQAPAEQVMEEVLSRRPDLVLVDPPRRGCHSGVLAALGQKRPSCLIYIACGVESFLRDAKILREKGFILDEVLGVDLFPHTPHLELVARFTPR